METLSVDLSSYVRHVEEQRNRALNEVAHLRAAVEELVAERDKLRNKVSELEGEVARLNELLTPSTTEPAMS